MPRLAPPDQPARHANRHAQLRKGETALEEAKRREKDKSDPKGAAKRSVEVGHVKTAPPKKTKTKKGDE